MFRELINTIPFSLLIIILIALFVIISYISAVLISPWLVNDERTEQANEQVQLANSLMAILTGGFFVLLAFIIINTWNYLQQASTEVSREANYLATIMRDIEVFSAEERDKITSAVGHYVVAVRVNEWQELREGKDSPIAWEAMEHLFSTIQHYHPRTDQEKLYYSEVINNINGVLQARRERLDKAESLIPMALSYSIVLGSLFLAFVLGLIRGKDSLIHLLPMLLFSGLFGFNLALALSFDYPYSGDISVSNKVFYSGVLGHFKD